MREVPMSNCEKDFILKAIAERRRLDGREIYDFRRIKISFGVDRGCCQVELGSTRVLVQVSCEVAAPKQARPSEGILFVNVELSPMAAPQFEAGRQSDMGVEINRILERTLKESRCVDTESLCIMAGLKVWSIRVDIHALNHDGNLIDCASIAAIAALAHFRRPDVTVSGEEVTIHSLEDRDPIPLSVHHMPLCVTFAFFSEGKYLLVDPSVKEEKVMDGKMVIGMNKHREICTLQMTGSMLLLKDQVLRCSNIAVVKVAELTELIQRALQNDSQARLAGSKFGFACSLEPKKATVSQDEMGSCAIQPDEAREKAAEIVGISSEDSAEMVSDSDADVQVVDKGTALLGEGGRNTWGEDDASDLEAEYADIIEQQQKYKTDPVLTKVKKPTEEIDLTGDTLDESEEEDVVVLDSTDLHVPKTTSVPQTRPNDTIDLTMALKNKGSVKSKKKNR